jgi:S-adenosylmethionine hydrolase
VSNFIITLTTDFGISSPYVAQMKGVILGCNPAATIVDVTHAIPPQNITAGAIALREVAMHFPPRSIHIAVVDPGVGSARQIIYVEAGAQRFVGPDNGLFSLVTREHPAQRMVAVTNRAFWQSDVSSTFHGRDIIAPVAARLSRGLDPVELGPALERMVELPWPIPNIADGRVTGEVTHIDAFGNAISNLRQADVARLAAPRTQLRVDVRGRPLRIHATYSQASAGDAIALFGSGGYLEIAMVNGSAANALGLTPGDAIDVSVS